MDRQLAESLYQHERELQREVVLSGLVLYVVLMANSLLLVRCGNWMVEPAYFIGILAATTGALFGVALLAVLIALWPRDYAHLPVARAVENYHSELTERYPEQGDALFGEWLVSVLVEAADLNANINRRRKQHTSIALRLTLTGILTFALTILAYGITHAV